MRKEPREYISPLLHPPLNRLFISRPRLEPLAPLNEKSRNESDIKNGDGSFLGKPKPSGITQSDLERLNNYKPSTLSNNNASTVELKREAKRKRREERMEENRAKLSEKIKNYKEPKVKGDAFKTVFLGRLPYQVNERTVRRELAPFGSILSVTLKKGKKGKKASVECYGFVEFERERDARRFVRENEEVRIEGRRAVVDVERARTVDGWLPRRLGGGLGGRNARGRDPRAISITRPLSATSSSSSSSSSTIPQSTVPNTNTTLTRGRTQVEYDDI